MRVHLEKEFAQGNKDTIQSRQRNQQYLKHILLINGLVYYHAYGYERIRPNGNRYKHSRDHNSSTEEGRGEY